MKKTLALVLAITSLTFFFPIDLFARGGGRGGGGGGRGGGGGGARMGGGGFSPSMSRPSGGMSRPSTPAARPNTGARPGGGTPGGARPGGGINPGAANRPGGGAPGNVGGGGVRPGGGPGTGAGVGRPGMAGGRPSAGQLNDFLNVPHPSNLPATRPGAGGAAGDFLKGERPSQIPAAPRPGIGEDFGAGNRPGVANRPGIDNRPGIANRPGIENRPGLANRPAIANRPNRIENRQQWADNRGQRWGEVRDQVRDNYPRLDFWADHPGWARWRINAPYRWAAWGALSGWLGYGAVAAYPYSYGDSMYYQDDAVYSSDGQPIATADEYAQQAEQIATSVPETPPDQSEWLPLGVFAITQDGQASGATPTMFLQLAVNKEGVINGLFNNKLTDETQEVEGMVDKESQRAAWTVKGKTRPIIETGINNLTTDSGPALIHFADGTTQQLLLVRLPDPNQ